MAAKKPSKKITVKTTRTVSPKSARAKASNEKSKIETAKKTQSVKSQKAEVTKQVDTKKIAETIKNPKVFIPVALVILAAILFLLRSWFIVAIVNGQPITRASFTRELEKKDGRDVLNSLVTKTLIFQEAAKNNVTISDSDVNAQL